MSVSSYKKPDIQTDFSSIPTWIYLILVAVLYTFGAYSFFDYITSSDPEKVSNLETLSEGFSALVPLELPFLPVIPTRTPLVPILDPSSLTFTSFIKLPFVLYALTVMFAGVPSETTLGSTSMWSKSYLGGGGI